MPSLAPLGPLAGDFIKYEADPQFCREAVTVSSGRILEAGTVVARNNTNQEIVACVDATQANGTHTPVGVLLFRVDASAAAQPGVILARGPAIVSQGALVWEATVNDAPKRAAKLALLLSGCNIVSRPTA